MMFRWLMYISFVIILISLCLLLWTYSVNRTFQSQTESYRQTDVPLQLPQQCGPGQIVPPKQKVSLIEVNGTKTRLVSAYQEHRRGQKEVRIIAVVLRNETVDYRCLLCCQDQLRISKGVINIHINHFGFAYGTADIMCPLPSGCETTSHIAIISAAAMSKDKLLDFVEVKNQKVKNESFPYNFTLCISAMYEFTNVLQMVQSLEMLQLLGVDRVVIYKSSCNAETRHILNYYIQKGLVEVIPWHLPRFMTVSRGFRPSYSPGEIQYFGQIPALNDCVYRYMYQSRYVALHDIDELILPQTVNSWLDLLPLLEKKYGPDKGYMFENNVFPKTVTKPPPTPQTLPLWNPSWQNVSGVNILAHLYHEPVVKEIRHSGVKIIVNPRVVFAPNVHNLLDSQNGCSLVDSDIGRMYHTRVPRTKNMPPEQLIYDGRLLSYSDRLIPAVNTVLKNSGILQEDSID